MKRYSVTVLIETDGDPELVLRAIRDSYAMAVQLGAQYRGPSARLQFSRPMTEAEAH